MVFRSAVVAVLALAMHCARGSEQPISRYDRVTIAPAKTSAYLASIAIAMSTFTRMNGTYEAKYTAKVVPFFFYNDTGRLFINLSDDQLRRLERNETVEFTGRAITEDGAERRVEGKATPVDAMSGKVKVRVFYSKRIELIFNTTYRFEPT
jgi:hypothetical protein